MNELQMIMQDAILFFKEIEDCEFTLEQPSLMFSKNVRNLEKLIDLINSLQLKSIDNIEFEKCSKKETIELTKELINKLYDSKYNAFIDEILSKFELDHTLNKFDAAICGDYDIKTGIKKCKCGIIYSWKELYSSVALVHEITHSIYDYKIIKGKNYNYNEFCSIFSELYACNYIDENLNKDMVNKYQVIRFNALKECCIEYCNTRNYLREFSKENKYLNNMELAYKYSYYNSYQYLIDTIYAFQLFNIYLQSPKEVLDDYRKVASNKIKVEDILNKYEISLKNKGELEEFQKKLIKSAN